MEGARSRASPACIQFESDLSKVRTLAYVLCLYVLAVQHMMQRAGESATAYKQLLAAMFVQQQWRMRSKWIRPRFRGVYSEFFKHSPHLVGGREMLLAVKFRFPAFSSIWKSTPPCKSMIDIMIAGVASPARLWS